MNSIKDTYHRIVTRLSAVSNEKGQTAIEYALVAVLIAIVLAVAFSTVKTGVDKAATKVNTELSK